MSDDPAPLHRTDLAARAAGLLLCLLIFIGGGCSKPPVEVAVPDVTQPARLQVRQAAGGGPVHGIGIRGLGHLDGTGTLSLMAGTDTYRVATLTGHVALDWDSDWYTPEATFDWQPAGVATGDLMLFVNFRD